MPVRSFRLGLAILGAAALVATALAAIGDRPRVASIPTPSGWRQHDMARPRPAVVEPADWTVAAAAPADAVVLFDGRDLSAWESSSGGPAEWPAAEGAFAVAPGKGAIQTRKAFGDVQLHLEWASPDPPRGQSQGRGNSGVFLMGAFELQVLDTYKADTYADGMAGAIYGQYPPLYNATRPPGQWQTYDVAFRAPRFSSSGALREPARITAFLNGVLVQNGETPVGGTSWLEAVPYRPGASSGPIVLQDHGHPVKFRNVWLRELPERVPATEAERHSPRTVAVPAAELDALAGVYGEGDFQIEISRQDDALLLKLPFRETPLRVVPVAPLRFVLPYADGDVVFEKDADGKPSVAKFRVADGAPRPLPRVE